jgi:hypothetical protein
VVLLQNAPKTEISGWMRKGKIENNEAGEILNVEYV